MYVVIRLFDLVLNELDCMFSKIEDLILGEILYFWLSVDFS